MTQPEVVSGGRGAGRRGSPDAPRDLRLITRVGGHAWLGRVDDGESRSVIAYRVAGQGDPVVDDAGSLSARVAQLTGVSAAALVPVIGLARRDDTIWLLSEWDDGVPLERLRRLTSFSPAQAAAVGIGLVAGLRALHDAGLAHGELGPDGVHLGPDGQVRLCGWGPAVLRGDCPVERLAEADLTAVAALVSDLGVTGVPDRFTDLDEAESALRAALRRADPRATALVLANHELAALGRAATGRPTQRTPAPPVPPAPRRPPVPPGTAPPKPDGWGRRALRAVFGHTWRWLVALLVLVTAVVLEFAFLHGRLDQDIHVLLGGSTTATPSRAPMHPPAPAVQPVAPSAAGAVTRVDLRPLGPCTAGRGCELSVLVGVQPHHTPLRVTWRFLLVDRCTGTQRSAPGGAATVPAGATSATTVNTVPLPPGRALAVFAVTGLPDRAAGTPVLIPDPGFC